MFTLDELLKATQGKLIGSASDLTIKGISTDSRTIKNNEAFIAIKGDNFDGHSFIAEAIQKRASCIISKTGHVCLSRRGIRNQRSGDAVFIEVKNTTKALGDIAQFHRKEFTKPVIAVTGSNGKTTTKEMIAWVLSKRYKVLKNEGTKNNHIGLPLTLLNLNSQHDLAVLEIGTNHFGEVDYLSKICLPNIGIITNIGPAHLEYLYNLEGVFREKYTLVKNLGKPYIAILNADDNLLKKRLSEKFKPPFILGLGIKNKSDFSASAINKLSAGKIEFLVNRKYKFTINTLGYFNIYNALAAIAVARTFGMEYKDIIWAFKNFDFPPNRLKFINLNHSRFIDDTYNSNPLSLREALEVLGNFKVKGRKIFVMGDMLELGKNQQPFHYDIGCLVAKICDILITVGALSKLSAEAARVSGLRNENIFICESPNQARDILLNKISPRKDDLVLVKGSRLMKMEEVLKK